MVGGGGGRGVRSEGFPATSGIVGLAGGNEAYGLLFGSVWDENTRVVVPDR